MATKNIGIQIFDNIDAAHDPRSQAELSADGDIRLRREIDAAFALVDASAGTLSGSVASAVSGSSVYTPISASQWQAPAPTTVKQALDRLANMVFLLTGSILH
jgi:hypothetical protein